MLSRRRLVLRKETLTELVSDDLHAVAGGASGPTCYTCVTACQICDTVIVQMLLSPIPTRRGCTP